MLYLSFKFVRKFKFCVSPLVKRYPAQQILCLTRTNITDISNFQMFKASFIPKHNSTRCGINYVLNSHSYNILGQSNVDTKKTTGNIGGHIL